MPNNHYTNSPITVSIDQLGLYVSLCVSVISHGLIFNKLEFSKKRRLTEVCSRLVLYLTPPCQGSTQHHTSYFLLVVLISTSVVMKLFILCI